MDHRSEIMSVLSRTSTWLLLVVLVIIGMFAISGESGPTDIHCLTSIKNSFQDPLNMISSWEFNNSTTDVSHCSFNGVECWDISTGNILRITLSGMGLSGEFPRGIANCKSLTALDLSNNHLYGRIPSDISRLIPYVTALNLSSNDFSGEIPPDIANCSYLNVLSLSSNFLRGQIPSSLASLQRLKSFTVANNLLSGPVPVFPSTRFPPEIYANNTGLCGYPLDLCRSRKGKSQKDLFISGFFFGWAVFFVLSVGFLTPISKFVVEFVKRLLAAMATPRLQSLPSSKGMDCTMIEMLEKFATRMSFLELSKATDNFSQSNIIAVGEMGTAYKGVLSNGRSLAVKRLWAVPHIEHEFLREITTLGRLRHRNLVPLLGFCYESKDRFLIHKFMPYGSLHDCLFSYDGETAKIIEWPVRVRIARGIAQGIAWLHQERVVHRGITSKCILLDENFNPRISDFGKATTPNASRSTLGLRFMRRESSVLASYEQDVHGFGIVLLELITGTEYHEIVSSYDDDDLSEHIFRLLNQPQALGICVDYMVKQGFGEEIHGFLRIAVKCVECDPGNCPSMEQVCEMLTDTARTHDVLDGSLDNEIELVAH